MQVKIGAIVALVSCTIRDVMDFPQVWKPRLEQGNQTPDEGICGRTVVCILF